MSLQANVCPVQNEGLWLTFQLQQLPFCCDPQKRDVKLRKSSESIRYMFQDLNSHPRGFHEIIQSINILYIPLYCVCVGGVMEQTQVFMLVQHALPLSHSPSPLM